MRKGFLCSKRNRVGGKDDSYVEFKTKIEGKLIDVDILVFSKARISEITNLQKQEEKAHANKQSHTTERKRETFAAIPIQ